MEVSINTFTIGQTFTNWSLGDFAGLGLILHIVLMIVMTLRVVSVQRNIGVYSKPCPARSNLTDAAVFDWQ